MKTTRMTCKTESSDAHSTSTKTIPENQALEALKLLANFLKAIKRFRLRKKNIS